VREEEQSSDCVRDLDDESKAFIDFRASLDFRRKKGLLPKMKESLRIGLELELETATSHRKL
jgi:hypothetical protein